MLGDSVYQKLEEALRHKVDFISGSTVKHAVSQVVEADNPLAAALPDLLTDKERELEEMARELRELKAQYGLA